MTDDTPGGSSGDAQALALAREALREIATREVWPTGEAGGAPAMRGVAKQALAEIAELTGDSGPPG